MPRYQVESRGRKFELNSEYPLTPSQIDSEVESIMSGQVQQTPSELHKEPRRRSFAELMYMLEHPTDIEQQEGFQDIFTGRPAGISELLSGLLPHPVAPIFRGLTGLLRRRKPALKVARQIIPERKALPPPETFEPVRTEISPTTMEAGLMEIGEQQKAFVIPPGVEKPPVESELLTEAARTVRGFVPSEHALTMEAAERTILGKPAGVERPLLEYKPPPNPLTGTPQHIYVAVPEGDKLVYVSKEVEGVREIQDMYHRYHISHRQKVVRPENVDIKINPSGSGEIGYKSPVSSFDGNGVFDPNVPISQPASKTWSQRMWSLIKDQRKKIPQEVRIPFSARPDTPVIRHFESWHAEIQDDWNKLVLKWHDALNRYRPEQIWRWEQDAYNLHRGGTTIEESILKVFPKDFAEILLRQQKDFFPAELAARQIFDLPEFHEFLGPYVPRMTEQASDDLVKIIRSPWSGLIGDFRTTIASFQKSREVPTALEGIAKGWVYADPKNSILHRMIFGLRLRKTAKMFSNLERDRVILPTRQDALAVTGGRGKPTKIEGLPGKYNGWWAPTEEEAVFMRHNLESGHSPFGNLNMWLNTWFRNPNLINPMPHFVKNMTYKYVQSGGNLLRLPKDMVRLHRNDPGDSAVRLFKETMPFPEYSSPAWEVLDKELGGNAEKIRRFLGVLNRGSSKLIFNHLDPGIKFSRWLQYVEKGMSPMEAANNVHVDLIRYGLRSDWTDFWKAFPGNFFVPWRTGTVMATYKNLRMHPFRTAATIGAVNYLREIAYRQTGQWFHLPIDYSEGPIAKAYRDPAQTPFLLATTYLLGPGAGTYTAQALVDMLRLTTGQLSDFEKRNMLHTFWGLSQLWDTGSEFAEYQDDQDPSHLRNILMNATLGAHQAGTRYQPYRFEEYLPEELPGLEKSPDVVARERIAEMERRPTLTERVGSLLE